MVYDPNANNPIDNDFHKVISDAIKQARKNKGYSLEAVVKKMKTPVSRQALYKYEQNKDHLKRENFKDLCNILDLNPHLILLQAYQYLDYTLTYNTKWSTNKNFGQNIYIWNILNSIEATNILSEEKKEKLKTIVKQFYNIE